MVFYGWHVNLLCQFLLGVLAVLAQILPQFEHFIAEHIETVSHASKVLLV